MERNDRLGMRVRPEDKERWKLAAARQNSSMSMWIETVLNMLSDQILGPRQPVQTKGQLSLDETDEPSL